MTISVEILLSILVILLVIPITSILWVRGIDHMHKNHPDYKGHDLFDEDEDEKDNSKN
jgi:hypothetical protein